MVHVAGARLPIQYFLRVHFEMLLRTAMSGLFYILVFGVSAQATTNLSAQATTNPKHILFLMIDDLGWNDVGYRKSSDLKVPTSMPSPRVAYVSTAITRPLYAPHLVRAF